MIPNLRNLNSYTNSPCLSQKKCRENSKEKMDTEVKMGTLRSIVIHLKFTLFREQIAKPKKRLTITPPAPLTNLKLKKKRYQAEDWQNQLTSLL